MNQSKAFYTFGKSVCGIILKLVYRYKVVNRNSLPEKGAYIVVCNHISFSDPPILALGQKRKFNFMAKAELFNNKFFGKILKALGAFPVQRGAGDGKALNYSEQLLQNGEVLGIFIEGTRSKTGDFLRPRSGAAMISYATSTPVVPACITPLGKHLFSRRVIRYGEPILPKELGLIEGGPKEFRNASRIIMEKIAELRKQDLDEHNSR